MQISYLKATEYISNYCHEEGIKYSHIRVHKIIYYSNIISILKLRKPLDNESFKNSRLGPVVGDLSSEIKIKGLPLSNSFFSNMIKDLGLLSELIKDIDTNQKSIIKSTMKLFNKFSEWDLVEFNKEKDEAFLKIKDFEIINNKDIFEVYNIDILKRNIVDFAYTKQIEVDNILW